MNRHDDKARLIKLHFLFSLRSQMNRHDDKARLIKLHFLCKQST